MMGEQSVWMSAQPAIYAAVHLNIDAHLQCGENIVVCHGN